MNISLKYTPHKIIRSVLGNFCNHNGIRNIQGGSSAMENPIFKLNDETNIHLNCFTDFCIISYLLIKYKFLLFLKFSRFSRFIEQIFRTKVVEKKILDYLLLPIFSCFKFLIRRSFIQNMYIHVHHTYITLVW